MAFTLASFALVAAMKSKMADSAAFGLHCLIKVHHLLCCSRRLSCDCLFFACGENLKSEISAPAGPPPPTGWPFLFSASSAGVCLA